MSNRLINEQSPYLLQHKDNPVDWYPWGDEAFRRAKEEDKPIFLSIGYSTCHWCHVMEHESFEDPGVARLLNETFVCIKVDREERPDIDGVYMTVCQAMTGHGGWPLTVLMTPDGKPFFAGTYIPKESRFGRMGMLNLVPRVQKLWQEERTRLLDSAEHITGSLRQAAAQSLGETPLDETELTDAYLQLLQRFDPVHGGFGEAPKFPSPHTLLFLLRYWKRSGEDRALEMVTKTLERMRLGGIYDHVGFGFHRYATDAEWLVPHFEKMLYDQAMLTMAYVEAYQATGNPAFARTAREVLAYVLRDMTDARGGFYSAEDADSEGREGAFYLWTMDELRDVLGDEDARFAIELFGVEAEGNFAEEATRRKTGENILHLKAPPGRIAEAGGIDESALQERVEQIRQRLFAHREVRVHPGKDDKVLTDWNGLMIAALARAARALKEPAYADAATRAAHFLRTTIWTKEGRLLHRYRRGEAALQANLDDYAFLIWGLLDLYETTFDVDLLTWALELNEVLLAHFWDTEHGAFFFTPDDGEALIVRQKEFYDGAIPSGNAVAMLNLLRLSRMTGDTGLEEKAFAVSRAAGAMVQQVPSGFTALLVALDFAFGPSFEVVVTGAPEADDTRALLERLHTHFQPNKVVLFRPASDEAAAPLAAVAPYVAAQRPRDGQATVYVCQNFHCNAPTTDADAMVAQLEA